MFWKYNCIPYTFKLCFFFFFIRPIQNHTARKNIRVKKFVMHFTFLFSYRIVYEQRDIPGQVPPIENINFKSGGKKFDNLYSSGRDQFARIQNTDQRIQIYRILFVKSHIILTVHLGIVVINLTRIRTYVIQGV